MATNIPEAASITAAYQWANRAIEAFSQTVTKAVTEWCARESQSDNDDDEYESSNGNKNVNRQLVRVTDGDHEEGVMHESSDETARLAHNLHDGERGDIDISMQKTGRGDDSGCSGNQKTTTTTKIKIKLNRRPRSVTDGDHEEGETYKSSNSTMQLAVDLHDGERYDNDFGKLEKTHQKPHPRTNMGVVDEHMEWQMTENERGDAENRQESVTGLTWADEHNGGRLSQKHPSDRLHYKPGCRRCKVRSPSWIKARGRGAGLSHNNVGRRDGDQRQIRSRRR